MLVPVAVNHVRAPEPAGGAGHERARRAERGHRADASSRVPARRLCSSRVAGVAVPVSGYASDFSGCHGERHSLPVLAAEVGAPIATRDIRPARSVAAFHPARSACDRLVGRRGGQLVANRRTSEVLAGNHILLGACELGFERLAVAFIDVDDEQARRIVAVDNRTSDLAGYDPGSLAALLSSLPDLAGTGYGDADLSKLLDELAEPGAADEPPPLPRRAETRLGELYAVGEHRLLCGDARKAEDLGRVCDRPAKLLLTDPPYGVDYQGKTSERLRIRGDAAAGLPALLSEAFAAAHRRLAPGAPFYVFHPAGPLSHTYTTALLAEGFELRQTLVWVKDQLVLGRSDYHYRHEPILYGYRGAPRARWAGWYGRNSEQSVIEVARPRASSEHPTAKPPELLER
jgi:hypothetical protein